MKGSLRERSPGVWELRIFLGNDPVTGRPRQAYRRARGTKRDAQRALAQFVTEQEQIVREEEAQRQADPPARTLNDLVVLLISEFDGAPGTLSAMRSVHRNHIAGTIGDIPIDRLDAPLLDRLYRFLRDERRLAPGSIRVVHSLIRRSLREAVRRGWLMANVAREARPPALKRNDITLPSADAVLELIDAAAAFHPDFGVFVRLAAATGARRGELCALRWSSFDFASNEVAIEASIAIGESGLVEKDTKNHARRVVVLDMATIGAVQDIRDRHRERAGLTGRMLNDVGFVFSDEEDSSIPWRPDSVSTRWDRVREGTGHEHVRLHDLRHFQATMLLKAGVPLKNVSKRLGHRDATTTLNFYAQFLDDVDHQSADVIGDLLTRK